MFVANLEEWRKDNSLEKFTLLGNIQFVSNTNSINIQSDPDSPDPDIPRPDIGQTLSPKHSSKSRSYFLQL